MQPSSTDTPLAARERTDSSLKTERHKADEALADGLRATDEAMGKSRDDADALTSKQRDATDAGGAPVDPALARERQITDATLNAERVEADQAIKRERAMRKGLERVHRYCAERLATDKDLASERGKIDDALLESTWQLSEERAAHDDTRLALTTRDQFLAIVSHDLRSPLSAILAGASLLAKAPGCSTEGSRERRAVDSIRRNAGGMLRLIGDLLDVERLATGKLELMLRKHDMRTLVQDTAETFAAQAAEKSLALSVELPPTPLIVLCDADRIMQVVMNLVDNAVKFTAAGGAVVITVTNAGGWAQVSVGDTGPGIPEGARSLIFERFSQLPGLPRTGLGLGLYIAKSIIGVHEGQLWVASEPGEGSIFSFSLRLAK